MNGIRQISLTSFKSQLPDLKKVQNTVAFAARNDKSLNKAAAGIPVGGFAAISTAVVALLAKFSKRSDLNVSKKAISELNASIETLSADLLKLREKTSLVNFDKAQANEEVEKLKETARAILENIHTLSEKNDDTGAVNKAKQELSFIQRRIGSLAKEINQAAKKSAATGEAVSDAAAAKVSRPHLSGALHVDGTITDEIKFKNGVAYNADDEIFVGIMNYELPDKSNVTMKTDGSGRIVYSAKAGADGKDIFEKFFKRKDTGSIEGLTVKTERPDGTKTFLVNNTKYSDGKVFESAMTTQAVQSGTDRVQVSLLTKSPDEVRLLDATNPNKARLVEIKGDDKTEIVLDRPFGYFYKGQNKGIDHYLMEDFPTI